MIAVKRRSNDGTRTFKKSKKNLKTCVELVVPNIFNGLLESPSRSRRRLLSTRGLFFISAGFVEKSLTDFPALPSSRERVSEEDCVRLETI